MTTNKILSQNGNQLFCVIHSYCWALLFVHCSCGSQKKETKQYKKTFLFRLRHSVPMPTFIVHLLRLRHVTPQFWQFVFLSLSLLIACSILKIYPIHISLLMVSNTVLQNAIVSIWYRTKPKTAKLFSCFGYKMWSILSHCYCQKRHRIIIIIIKFRIFVIITCCPLCWQIKSPLLA